MDLKYRDSGGSFPDFDPDTDIKDLLQPCFENTKQPTASHLKVHNRLLLHIIYNVVLPRKGSLTYIPKLVFALLHYLNNKIKINYAFLIVGHMFTVAQGTVSGLPHATLITFWLSSVFKIKSKSQSQCIRSFLLYDHTTLNHMFFYDENTQTWNLKKALQGSSSVISDPSMSNNTHTPTYKNLPRVQIPDAPLFSPPSVSSINHSKTTPVTPYTPTAPAYSPFPSTNPLPNFENSPEPTPQPDISEQPSQPAQTDSIPEPDNFQTPSQPSPQPTFPKPQHQPSYSLPSIDRFMESVKTKLDDLRTNTPSATSFKSACDQLFTQVSEAQISTSIYLQRIEEKVDAYETKMKEYGHLTHDCMMQLLNSQKSMADTQRSMTAMQHKINDNQAAMKQMIINLTEAYLEAPPARAPINPIDVDSPTKASTSAAKKSSRQKGGR